MPLGKLTDYKDARFAGLALTRPGGIVDEVELARQSGFDFIVTPLASSTTRRHRSSDALSDSTFRRPDMVMGTTDWSGKVVGRISDWVDLDSTDAELRKDSVAAVQQEVAWAVHIGIQAVIMPSPRTTTCAANYAQVRLNKPCVHTVA